MNYLKQP